MDFVHARQRVQHAQIGFGVGEHIGVQIEFALDFGEFLFVEAFALHARHIQNIRPCHRAFQIGEDLPRRACFVQLFGNVVGHGERGRRHKGKFAAKAFKGLGERMHGAPVFQIAHHGDFQVFQAALGFVDGYQIQQGLAGVLVGAVARVEHGHMRKLGGYARRAVLRMALDNRIGVAADDARAVGKRFAFFRAGVGAIGKANHLAAQALHGGFKRKPGACGRLKKTACDEFAI